VYLLLKADTTSKGGKVPTKDHTNDPTKDQKDATKDQKDPTKDPKHLTKNQTDLKCVDSVFRSRNDEACTHHVQPAPVVVPEGPQVSNVGPKLPNEGSKVLNTGPKGGLDAKGLPKEVAEGDRKLAEALSRSWNAPRTRGTSAGNTSDEGETISVFSPKRGQKRPLSTVDSGFNEASGAGRTQAGGGTTASATTAAGNDEACTLSTTSSTLNVEGYAPWKVKRRHG
jgi:hypothetical protein